MGVSMRDGNKKNGGLEKSSALRHSIELFETLILNFRLYHRRENQEIKHGDVWKTRK
jgi:hypothetical protein